MDYCIVPIELIEIICRHDCANWPALIRTCRRVYVYLSGLRWAAKVAIMPLYTYVIHRYQMHVEINIRCKNGITRTIYTDNHTDYWEITGIFYRTGDNQHMFGESISFVSDGIGTIFYYHDDICVGGYFGYGDPGKRYFASTSEYAHVHSKKYGTKTTLMARLDEMGIKYTWLKCLKIEI
ncbi:hypothetical protein F-M6_0005 [Faustovirus]|nr:hypothetical protein F-M6_0005 [Faustovirus]